ncbi:hypothetical protein V6Z11_A07G127600 [Gossypium hirsutum]
MTHISPFIAFRFCYTKVAGKSKGTKNKSKVLSFSMGFSRE